MKQYNVRFDKTINLVLAMIFPPLLIMPVIYLLAKYAPGLHDSEIGIIITVIIVLILVFTLNLVKKLSPQGVLILYEDRFVMEFPNRGAFSPASFEVQIKDILNCYAGVSKAGYYLRFITNSLPEKFNLSAGSAKEEDTEAFDELILLLAAMIAAQGKTLERLN